MKKTSRRKRIPPVEIIDFDALWKDFITEFLAETTQATLPDLWELVDWSVNPEFLEQEFINTLRGKFKIKDKRKHTDKLVKLRLLTGEDHYILFHIEVQGALELLFGKRMFMYKALSFLRYNTEEFTALTIFIAKPPDAVHLKYEHKKFGTTTTYEFNAYAVANQLEADLMASNNLFHLAVLAVKYTLDTEGDDLRRFKFKRKVYELADAKNVPLDRLHRFLTFVGEYMGLKPDLENEFQAQTPYFQQFKSEEKMYTTWRTRSMADVWYKHATGKTIQEELDEKDAILSQKDAALTEAILAMHREAKFSAERIANILDLELSYVNNIIETAAV